MIPRADWRAIKARLHRRPAFTVDLDERRAIRAVRSLVSDLMPDRGEALHLVPISSMQAASTVTTGGATRVAIIDIEQANALSFLMAREYWHERPIFSYVEFMIRAAETLYDDGEADLALAVSSRTNRRLRDYAAHHDALPEVPRPQVIDPTLIPLMQSYLILRFVAGHEMGHLLQATGAADLPAFAAARRHYDAHRFEDSRFGDAEAIYDRYVKPISIQKFDDTGQFAGDATRGQDLMGRYERIVAQQQREVEADILGLIAATGAAAEAGLHPDAVFSVLVDLLEHCEFLMVLSTVLPQLPRGQKRGAIAPRMSSLVARKTVLVKAVVDAAAGEDWVPEVVADYWRHVTTDLLEAAEDDIESGAAEQLALRATILLRGGLHIGIAGDMPPHPEAAVFESYPPALRGQLLFQHAHLRPGPDVYRIESHHEVDPQPGTSMVPVAFACAIRDLAEVAATPRPRRLTAQGVLRGGSDADFVEALRSARTQVMARGLNPDWARGFPVSP